MPEAAKPEEPAPNPADQPPAPAPPATPGLAELKKNLFTEIFKQLDPVFVKKDELEKMVAEQAQKAISEEVRKAIAEESRKMIAEEVQKMVATEVQKVLATEVQKQLESSLKAIPAVRKGLVTQEPEQEDAKKTFENLSPEKKLRVALALQQA